MTSNAADEVPHFRGNTLTPESPQPVHIPEPSSIPVLERQIDPLFNLMSTHMENPHALRDLTALDHEMAYGLTAHASIHNANTHSHGDELGYGTNRQDNSDMVHEDDGNFISLGKDDIVTEQEQSDSSVNQNQSSFLANQLSTSVASHDTLSAPSHTHSTSDSFTLPHSGDPSQHLPAPLEPSQASSMIIEQIKPEVTDDDDAGRKGDLRIKTEENDDEDVANEGVNYQTLLDNISPPGINDLSAEHFSPLASSCPPTEESSVHAASSTNASSGMLAGPVGLPPRPPPQEKPAIHPNYMPGEDIRSYHYPHVHHTNAQTSHSSVPNNTYRPAQGYAHPVVAAGAPGTSSAPNGLPPPPMATFQQPQRNQVEKLNSPSSHQARTQDNSALNGNGSVAPTDDGRDPSWTPEIERKYEDFLNKERIFVSEGVWDRFPPGSRLFVGNLPTESVSKRDLFLIFHKYGDLAQISIKQAFGFIQYLDARFCYRAKEAEHGLRIKDRHMNLEIAKPQKNTRNAAATADGDSLRASYVRRSRSPDYGRGPPSRGMGQRFSGDRYVGGVPFSDFRDEPRRRDDYRPIRSPSPRGFRGRDEFRGARDRSPDRYYGRRRSRSRSPFGRPPVRYRSPSPRRRELDEDATLPIPRRNPRDIPDVQMILVDELDRAFVAYIEKSFRDRGLRSEVMLLPPRLSLAAVIKRQILEGVPAVVKLHRSAQVTGKIPLQVFDRSRGTDDVRFEEYEDLDAHIAAELVVRAKSANVASVLPRNQHPGPGPAYVNPAYPPFNNQSSHQQQPPSTVAQPNIANLITSLDGPALQKLLGAMQQSPQTPQGHQQHIPQHHVQQTPPAQSQDLAALLGTVNRQQAPPYQVPPQQGYPYPPSQPQQSQQPPHTPLQQYQYGNPAANVGYTGSGAPHHAAHPLQQAMPPQYQQPQQGQQHVQNIMEQLAKWKRDDYPELCATDFLDV